MADFKKLKVWQKAHQLSLDVHRSAGKIRGADNIALRSQMKRSAQSISANIVEGRGKRSEKEFVRYLDIASGSANELEAHLITARDTGLMQKSDFVALLDSLVEVRKMLHGLINRLQQPPSSPR